MTSLISQTLQTLLDYPLISRTRRNHGLEHATLHVLAQKFPEKPLAGHSDTNGFWLLGDVPTEEVKAAVEEALSRLKNGEHQLAVHPNCGTNFAVAGTLAGLAGALGLLGVGRRWRDKLERLPLVASLATIALIFAQPLGLRVQREVTTSGVPGSLEVVKIVPSIRGRIKAHRVLTRG
ncbi:MAG: hypothetical protein J7L73_00985 [Anaerolineales bacterium]|nr:hypothetical protein [Anaerolineales bacterium]